MNAESIVSIAIVLVFTLPMAQYPRTWPIFDNKHRSVHSTEPSLGPGWKALVAPLHRRNAYGL